MADLPKAVHIMEVGARDGLQIEPRTLSADDKARLIDALVGAGISEITSCSPTRWAGRTQRRSSA